jgi:hypothetical protein
MMEENLACDRLFARLRPPAVLTHGLARFWLLLPLAEVIRQDLVEQGHMTKKNRMKSKTSHPSNENFALRTLTPVALSTVKKLKNFFMTKMPDNYLKNNRIFKNAVQYKTSV